MAQGEKIVRNIATLNIGNTFRSSNLNIASEKIYQDVNNTFPYTINQIKKHIVPQVLYKIKYNFKANDTLNHELIKQEYLVRYETDSVIPFPVLLDLGKSKSSYPVYPLKKEYTDKEIDNIKVAMLAAEDQTVITTTLDIINQSSWDILFNISVLRYFVKRLEIHFKSLSSNEFSQLSDHNKTLFEEYRGRYVPTIKAMTKVYQETHEPLARWRIQDYLIVPDKKYQLALKDACNQVLPQ